ncbi:growth/differentiation factor 15-like [Erythrolamprus reginae]|uniref:growth/differentiation factor 15-like n=1 Tax=Erythrolamprus reginae TaxID=121349 RepID=UPI00396CD33F
MFLLVFLPLLLARMPGGGGISDLRKGDPAEEQQIEISVLTLDGSCREQILQRARTAMCQLLRLDHPPRLTASMTQQVREEWAKEGRRSLDLSMEGPILNITSNQTLVSRRGGCLQISQYITLDDLGWQNWVLSPTSFTFTECLGCHCHRIKEETQLDDWRLACGLQEPSHQSQVDAQQRRCCRPQKTPLPFLFLKEDGSFNLQTVRLAHDCHCRP